VDDPLFNEREAILSQLLRFAASVGLLAFIPGLVAGIAEGLWAIVAIDTIAYIVIVVTALVPRIPFGIKLAVLVGASLCVGTVVLVATGPLGAGYIWILAAVVLSALFGRQRIVVLTSGLSLAVMLGWAFALHRGAEGYGARPATVLIIAGNMAVVCLALAIMTRRLLTGLTAAFDERVGLADRLADELRRSMAVRDELEHSLVAKESLLRELQHRVRNNLQMVQSLLSIDEGDERDGAAIGEAKRRIKALTVVNDMFLSDSESGHVDSRELLRSIAQLSCGGRRESRLTERGSGTAPSRIETQTAALLAVLASDIVAAVSAIGHPSIFFEPGAERSVAEIRCPESADDAAVAAIVARVSAGRIARSARPDITIGRAGDEPGLGPGVRMEF